MVLSNRTDDIPDFFKPVFYYPKKPRDKDNSRCKDNVYNGIVHRVFGKPKTDYGVVRPNVQTAYQDYFKAYQHVRKGLNPEARKLATQILIELLAPAFKGGKGELMKYEEAVFELENKTSPGFPYNTKFEWKYKEAVKLQCDWLREAVDRMMKGEIRALWGVNVKEEVREKQKIDDGNARTFKSGPIDLNIIGGMATNDFCEKITDNWKDIPVKIGINMYRGNWHDMILKMVKDRDYHSSDAPKFDAKYPVELYEVVLEVMKAWTNEECWPYLEVMMSNMSNSITVMPDGRVFWQEGSMPSGGPATIFWNSLGRLFQFVYVAVIGGCRNVQEFVENVDIMVVGDDCVYGVSQEYSWFTNEYFNSIYSELGWGLYSDDKVPVFKRENLFFLSHSTRKLSTKFVPCHAFPEKNLASMILMATRVCPGDWPFPAYQLSRLLGNAVSCYGDQDFYPKYNTTIQEFIEWYAPTMGDNKYWKEACAMWKSDREHVEFYTLPEGYKLQSCVLGKSGLELSALLKMSSKKQHAHKAGPKMENGSFLSHAAKQLKQMAKGHKGFRNKLSVSGGAPKAQGWLDEVVEPPAQNGNWKNRSRPKTKFTTMPVPTREVSFDEASMRNVPFGIGSVIHPQANAESKTKPLKVSHSIGSVTLKSTATPGSGNLYLVLSEYITPNNYNLFRNEAVEASVYEQFSLKHFNVKFLPNSMTSDGVILMYIDTDPIDSSMVTEQQITDNSCSVRGTKGSQFGLSYHRKGSFYTNPSGTNITVDAEKRQDFAGVLRVYVSGVSPPASGSTNLGSLWLDASVTLHTRTEPRPLLAKSHQPFNATSYLPGYTLKGQVATVGGLSNTVYNLPLHVHSTIGFTRSDTAAYGIVGTHNLPGSDNWNGFTVNSLTNLGFGYDINIMAANGSGNAGSTNWKVALWWLMSDGTFSYDELTTGFTLPTYDAGSLQGYISYRSAIRVPSGASIAGFMFFKASGNTDDVMVQHYSLTIYDGVTTVAPIPPSPLSVVLPNEKFSPAVSAQFILPDQLVQAKSYLDDMKGTICIVDTPQRNFEISKFAYEKQIIEERFSEWVREKNFLAHSEDKVKYANIKDEDSDEEVIVVRKKNNSSGSSKNETTTVLGMAPFGATSK